MSYSDSARPGVSVILPALLCPETAGRCLKALLGQRYVSLEVIVLACGGFRSRHADDPRVKVMKVPEDALRLNLLGRGADRAEGEISVWLDPVFIPQGRDWLWQMVQPFQDASAGAVIGLCRTGPAGGGLKGHFRLAVGRLTSCKYNKKRLEEVDVLSFRCEAFRSEIIRGIGLEKDSGLPPLAEPVELSMRIRKAGWKIMFQPRACAEARPCRAEPVPGVGVTLLHAFSYGEADAVLGRQWGIAWLNGRIFMAALISVFLPLLALFSLPYALAAAGLLFLWGWFAGFRIPFIPWEWPAALVNMGIFILLILAVRDDWRAPVITLDEYHPAVIRQWLFVLAVPLSYMLMVLAAGLKTALRGLSGAGSASCLPALVILASLWHILSGLGYARETLFPACKTGS